jgi:hypothetical protein
MPDSCFSEPKKKTESLFAGIRLQYFISYVCAFVGAIMWMAEIAKAQNQQNEYLIICAKVLLGASGSYDRKLCMAMN